MTPPLATLVLSDLVDLEIWSDLSCAGCKGLWCTLDLDQAHSAVTCYRQPLMVTESGDFNPCFSACLKDGVRSVDRNGLSINVNVELGVEVL
jgi:hypothetical protein